MATMYLNSAMTIAFSAMLSEKRQNSTSANPLERAKDDGKKTGGRFIFALLLHGFLRETKVCLSICLNTLSVQVLGESTTPAPGCGPPEQKESMSGGLAE